jgi:branched-chain amino acid aminotransferase
MSNICFNGNFISSALPVFQASNRGFAYGDGLFETIRVSKGFIPLAGFHFERLFQSMDILQIPQGALSIQILTEYILELCEQNHCLEAARVRLAVYRSMDEQAHFLIQAVALDDNYRTWNDRGWKIDIFNDAQKSTDIFSCIKSANFLPYVMAGLYAKKNHIDDALVMNTRGRIADSTRANIFILKNDKIITPSLEEGGINGVMRKLLIKDFLPPGQLQESHLTIKDLEEADEIFLTNALFGLRWVGQFRNRVYGSTYSENLYSSLSSTIFS